MRLLSNTEYDALPEPERAAYRTAQALLVQSALRHATPPMLRGTCSRCRHWCEGPLSQAHASPPSPAPEYPAWLA